SGFHSFLNHREAIRRASLIARTSPIETDHRSWYGSNQTPSVGAHNQNEESHMTAVQSQDLTVGPSVTATPSSNTTSIESHSHRDNVGDARARTVRCGNPTRPATPVRAAPAPAAPSGY